MDTLVQFKKGIQEELDSCQQKEGQILFTTDEGNLYIDTAEERKQVNAKGATELIKQNKSTVSADNVVTTNDTIKVDHGGTGLTELPNNEVLIGNGADNIKSVSVTADNFVIGSAENGITGVNAETARDKLAVYDKTAVDQKVKEATSVAYSISLTVEGWVDNSTENLKKYGTYIQEVNIPTLTGGKNHNVPPIISCTSDNADDYNKINSAQATVGTEENKISFFVDEKPTAQLDLTIIDVS